MKWTFFIRQKLKIALLLGGVLLLVGMTTFLERKHMANMDKSFTSIYNDRLIPTTEIFYLAEQLYQKRLTLQRYFLTGDPENVNIIYEKLNEHNEVIDTLIHAFEKSHLVENEFICFKGFKNDIKDYASLEQSMLVFCEKGQQSQCLETFDNEAQEKFASIIARLNELTGIQTEVGSSILSESKVIVAGANVVSRLQIALILIIGIIIQILVLTSKAIKTRKHQKFSMN